MGPIVAISVVERLERRQMFSAGVAPAGVTVASLPPPTVTDVYVSGSAWSQSFKDYLGAEFLGAARYGYKPLRGPDPMPWVNINQVTIFFTSGVRVDAADLTVRGVAVPDYPVVSVQVEEQRHPLPERTVATFTLARPLGTDRVTLEVNADPPDGVDHPYLGYLDGDDDLQPGGDYRRELQVVVGGAGGDSVSMRSLFNLRRRILASTEGPTTGPTSYTPWYDVNADGRIGVVDYALVRRRLYTYLPPAQPPPAAATSPATSPADDLFSAAPVLA
jgi:hypothetical protein